MYINFKYASASLLILHSKSIKFPYSQIGSPRCSPLWSKLSSLPGFLLQRSICPFSVPAWLPACPSSLKGCFFF